MNKYKLTIVILLFVLLFSLTFMGSYANASAFNIVNNTNIKFEVKNTQPNFRIVNNELQELSINPIHVKVKTLAEKYSFLVVSDYRIDARVKKLSEALLKKLKSNKDIKAYVQSSSYRDGNFWDSSYSIEVELTQYFQCYYNVYDYAVGHNTDLIHYDHRIIKILYLDPQVSAREADYYYANSGNKYKRNSDGSFVYVGREVYHRPPNILGSAYHLQPYTQYYFYNPSSLYWDFLPSIHHIIYRTAITLKRGQRIWKMYVETVASGGVIYLDSGAGS